MILKNLLKCFFAIAILVNFSQAAFAQKFDVKWSEKVKLKYDFDDAVALPNGKSIVLKLKLAGGGMFSSQKITPVLMLVDKNMETLKEQELLVEEKNAKIKGFEKFGNNVYFVYNFYDKDSKTTSTIALKINQDNLNTISRTTLGTYESDSKSDQAEVNYKISSDSSKVFLFVEGPDRKKENKKIYFSIYDNDLKRIWSKETELPMLDRYSSIYDNDITNDGKVIVAVKHYDKEVSRESVREDGSKVPSYKYKLFVFEQSKATPREIILDLGDNFVQGTKIAFTKSGAVTIAGMYKKKYNGNITGAFYANMDGTTGEIKNPKMVEFPEDLVRLVDKDGFGSDKKSDPGLYRRFQINQILTRPNGSIDLVSEYYRLDVVNTNYNGRFETHYHYYYGDIVSTNIDKDGKATFTRIPKNQKFVDMNIFMGYYPLIFKDKLILLFNDDKDNVDRDLEKKPDDIMKFKNSVLVAATIDTKGNLTREAIFSNDDDDYIMLPRNTSKTGENTYLISADLFKIFKKRTKFAVLTIK